MKKIILALLLIGSTNVFAGNINLGEGNIGSGSRQYPAYASLTLKALTYGVSYDITCIVNDPDAQAYPVVAKFDIEGNGFPQNVYLDGTPLVTHQGRLSDNKDHIVSFPQVSKMNDSGAVSFTWLAGDGVADPIHYVCTAFPSVGKAK